MATKGTCIKVKTSFRGYYDIPRHLLVFLLAVLAHLCCCWVLKAHGHELYVGFSALCRDCHRQFILGMSITGHVCGRGHRQVYALGPRSPTYKHLEAESGMVAEEQAGSATSLSSDIINLISFTRYNVLNMLHRRQPARTSYSTIFGALTLSLPVYTDMG